MSEEVLTNADTRKNANVTIAKMQANGYPRTGKEVA